MSNDTTISKPRFAKRNKIKESLPSRIFDVFNIILFIVLAAIMIIPLWNVLMISLTTQGEYFKRPLVLLPYGFNLDAYKFLFSGITVPRAYGVTAIVTVCGTLLSLLCTSMLAYPLSKSRLMGRKIFTMYLVITMFFSGGLIPSYLLIKNTLGLGNNLLALILPSGVSVWNFIIMRSFFQQMPESFEESAKIDGANDFTILFKIIYPLSIPVLSTLGLFVAVGLWNSWFAAKLYMSKQSLHTLQLVLRTMVKDNAKPAELTLAFGSMRDAAGNPISMFEDGLKMAMVVIAVVPMLLIYPFIQRYFEKGIMIGSIKG